MPSLHIPKSVTQIYQDSFIDCFYLSRITVDSRNPKFDSRNNCNAIIETASNKLCFGCNSTVIPGDIESIGIGAFRSKTGLTSVTVPEGVKTIEYDTFKGCNGLKEVNLPQSLEMIG